ncbi:hypothetical protein CFOL_v3_11207, partial [Cephalotus follicularis]
LNNEFGVAPHPKQLYKARNNVREVNEHKHIQSFYKLMKYAELLRETNPGTMFKRVFVCYEAMEIGFLERCRPFIGFDGCHLKGCCLEKFLLMQTRDYSPWPLLLLKCKENIAGGFSWSSCTPGLVLELRTEPWCLCLIRARYVYLLIMILFFY